MYPALDPRFSLGSDRSAWTRSANTATSPDPNPPGGSGMPLTQLQTLHAKD
jgi:hypothetical protein